MAALPQQLDVDGDERGDAHPETSLVRDHPNLFRVRPRPAPPGYYRNRPLIRLRCRRPPALPGRPSDPVQIQLVAPIPGLAELAEVGDLDENGADDGPDDDGPDHDGPDNDGPDDDDDGPDDDADVVRADDRFEGEDDLLDEDLPSPTRPNRPRPAHPRPGGSRLERSRTGAPPTPGDPVRRDPLPALLTAIVLGLLIVLGAAGVLVIHNQSGSGPSTAAFSAPPSAAAIDAANQAASWTKANLPSNVKLLADPNVRSELVGLGFTAGNIGTIDDGALDSTATRYLVVTPAIRLAGQRAGSPVANLLANALPVAVFGNGQDRVEVSQLGAMGTSLTTAQQARLMAGQALQRNPSVHIVAGLVPVVSDGRVDMRADTVLAVLAAQSPVSLLALPQASAETRAGAPIRTISFSLGGDPAAADTLVGATVRSLPASMAPYQTSHRPDGTYRIVWLPDLALTPPVN